jgi:glycerol uptake facilitator-like aquaporin
MALGIYKEYYLHIVPFRYIISQIIGAYVAALVVYAQWHQTIKVSLIRTESSSYSFRALILFV